MPVKLSNAIRRIPISLQRGLWLVLVFLLVRGVEQYSRRPVWSRELPQNSDAMLAGWMNDDQIVLAFSEWDKRQQLRFWTKLRVYDQATGDTLSEYDLPKWPMAQVRVQGERVHLGPTGYRDRPYFDLAIRQFGIESVDQSYEQITPSGRWRSRRGTGYAEYRVQDRDGPWELWPSDEQLASWGMTRSSYEVPADKLVVNFWGLKFSPDETRVATVCEQRKPEKTYGDWVGRIHAWPSGDILHEWPLSNYQGNHSFEIVSLPWEGDTFFVEEVLDTIGDGNTDDTINRWFRCQVRDTGVEMTVLDWTDWDDYNINPIGSRWLQPAEGQCLETYYHSRRDIPFPSWGWKYRFTRWIYDSLHPLLYDNSALLRDTLTGEVLWQGPKQGFGVWQISPDRQFMLGLPSRYYQPEGTTVALYPLTPRRRWPWHAAIAIVAVWGWRSIGRSQSPMTELNHSQ